jgi:hypothetical protein
LHFAVFNELGIGMLAIPYHWNDPGMLRAAAIAILMLADSVEENNSRDYKKEIKNG